MNKEIEKGWLMFLSKTKDSNWGSVKEFYLLSDRFQQRTISLHRDILVEAVGHRLIYQVYQAIAHRIIRKALPKIYRMMLRCQSAHNRENRGAYIWKFRLDMQKGDF